MNLCWWEYEQLLDHLRSRGDIWASSHPSVWVRSFSYDESETIVCCLRFTPPRNAGPFRQYACSVVPMEWTVEQADEYLQHLLESWTDYGRRKRFETFLRDELRLESALAANAAIALCSLDEGLNPGPDPDRLPLPTARELFPDVQSPLLCLADGAHYLRTYGFTGGGWFTISLTGGMLRVRASLPSHGRYGGGYSQPFEGFVRPYNGNVNLAAAALFGDDMIEAAPMPHLREKREKETDATTSDDGDLPLVLGTGSEGASGASPEAEDTGHLPEPK